MVKVAFHIAKYQQMPIYVYTCIAGCSLCYAADPKNIGVCVTGNKAHYRSAVGIYVLLGRREQEV